LSAIDGAPRAATVTAIARSRLCIIPARSFLDFVFATPSACHALLRSLAAQLRLQAERTLEREALPVRLRLMAELLRLSSPHPAAPGERVVSPPPPHHDLAARIGARREVVSRGLFEMTREGWLARDRRAICILRAGKMQAMVAAELRMPA
jgi:CRP-like cAMP-binding protein